MSTARLPAGSRWLRAMREAVPLCALLAFGWGAAAAVTAMEAAGEAAAAPPQSAEMDYVVDFWRTEQGLPHNTVSAILQTREGYLWLGTAGGLVRFDGIT